jgi:hypothetical protein
MALVYARVYCNLKAGEAAAIDMAKADTRDNEHDALHLVPPTKHEDIRISTAKSLSLHQLGFLMHSAQT